MQNSIEVHIEFSFKGETHALTSTVDLDQLLARYDSLPSLYLLLAKEHGIDTYSYLYEVMEVADIEFINAQGIAEIFMVDGKLNFAELESSWHELRIPVLLQPIATQEMGITDLNQHPSLKNTLIQAYKLGKASPPD